jgi:hypothetical protein
MTKQRKNERNRARAASITTLHKNGDKGPAKTSPQHGKRWGYRTNPEVQKRIAEMLKATTAASKEKTSGRKILEKAGAASKDEG